MSRWQQIRDDFLSKNSAVTQLLYINVGVFVFGLVVVAMARIFSFQASDLLNYFYLPSSFGKLLIRPWSLVTHVFFHAGIRHILFNMLVLYFIGRILEQFLNRNQVWNIFVVGGIAGGLFYVLGYNLIPSLQPYAAQSVLLGASGGVSAIVAAAGFHIPYYVIRPFGLFQTQMRWIAVFLIVILNLMTFGEASNDGGVLAHLGGAVFGALFIMNLQGRLSLPKVKLRKTKMKRVHLDESKRSRRRSSKPNQIEIDAILDKISQSGYNSLTAEEKDTLFKASE